MTENVVKPERPGGFLDWLPADYLAREKIIRKIEGVFRSYGFDPIETPRVEFLKTLAGETSDTGKNIFHIRGTDMDEPLAMPFDHTVPFARLLAANPYDAKRKAGIRLPWRRMVVGPVFRADTPQSGRYRQFYQLDMDIAGSSSMMADAEIVAMMIRTMDALGVENFRIRLNNRKILNGLASIADIRDRAEVSARDIIQEMMRILDKLDKIHMDGVTAQLSAEPKSPLDPAPHLSDQALKKVRDFISISGSNEEKLARAREIFTGFDSALEGICELEQILGFLSAMKDLALRKVVIDFSIARGLDYYTGPVMEMNLTDAPEFGSVFSGGRYNDLVRRFTGMELPATGTSIGIDRLYAALEHIGAMDRSLTTVTEVMVLRIAKDRDADYIRIADMVRAGGRNTEICLAEDTTFKKQFNFAISKNVKYVVICGENEFDKGTVQVKNLATREQEEILEKDLTDFFSEMPD